MHPLTASPRRNYVEQGWANNSVGADSQMCEASQAGFIAYPTVLVDLCYALLASKTQYVVVERLAVVLLVVVDAT